MLWNTDRWPSSHEIEMLSSLLLSSLLLLLQVLLLLQMLPGVVPVSSPPAAAFRWSVRKEILVMEGGRAKRDGGTGAARAARAVIAVRSVRRVAVARAAAPERGRDELRATAVFKDDSRRTAESERGRRATRVRRLSRSIVVRGVVVVVVVGRSIEGVEHDGTRKVFGEVLAVGGWAGYVGARGGRKDGWSSVRRQHATSMLSGECEREAEREYLEAFGYSA
jgi:hypothetical protein